MIKVLIADDQELFRQSLSIILKSEKDFEVTEAVSTGVEVVRSVRSNKPDVILMDIRMPEMDGVVCTQIIKENYPDIKLQKYDSYANAKNALENGNAAAWTNDNTEVIAYALQNEGYTVGIPTLGSNDTIAPAVTKGNDTLLNWLNDEIVKLGERRFFHEDYEATLADTYGTEYEESLVVEGGKTK